MFSVQLPKTRREFEGEHVTCVFSSSLIFTTEDKTSFPKYTKIFLHKIKFSLNGLKYSKV